MLSKKLFSRIIFNLVILISVFFMPWYIQILLVSMGIIVFNFFIESIFFAFFLDFIFSTEIDFFWNFQYLYTSLFVIMFFLIEWIKTKTR